MTTDTNTQVEQERPPLKFADEMHEMQHNLLTQMITQRNALVGRHNAANGDRLTLTEEIRNNSTDEAIVSLREQIAQLELDLDALVKPQVDKIIEDNSGSVDEIEKKIAELDGKLKPGITYYKKLYDENSYSYLPKQERLKGATVRSASGGKRVRGFNVIVTIDGEAKEFENFGTAAKYIGVDASDLQEAFFTKAGVQQSKDAPNEVSFVINFDEVDSDNNKTEKEASVKAYRTEVKVDVPTETSNDEPEDEDVVEESEDYDPEDLENI